MLLLLLLQLLLSLLVADLVRPLLNFQLLLPAVLPESNLHQHQLEQCIFLLRLATLLVGQHTQLCAVDATAETLCLQWLVEEVLRYHNEPHPFLYILHRPCTWICKANIHTYT